MNNQIISTLKSKLEEIAASTSGAGVEIQRNAAKEVLQYYVLNFIYNHSDYQNWIMYGGSALRICHDLDRMSVDLDFEVDHEVTNKFLENFKNKLLDHFKKTCGIESDLLTVSITNKRGLTLKFHIAEELGLPFHSKQVHVKVDLNHFPVHPKIVTERWPQNEYQLSFVIKTYNMSALMASKIAAIFLRGKRVVGSNVYEEKGRDIYDLAWYMSKRIVPDLDYLKAKKVEEAKNLRTLFDKLTLKMNEVSDQNLKDDLMPLFVNQTYIANWLKHWREFYMRQLEKYEIHTVTSLEKVRVFQDFSTDVFSFIYYYSTDEKGTVRVIYKISDYWIDFREGDLPVKISKKITDALEFSSNDVTSHPVPQDKLMQYAELFYQKCERYFESTNHVMLGDTIETKLIRMTADNLNQKEQILLNKSTLLNCELEDLLK